MDEVRVLEQCFYEFVQTAERLLENSRFLQNSCTGSPHFLHEFSTLMHSPEKFTNLSDSEAYEQSFSVSDNLKILYDTTADTFSTDLTQRGFSAVRLFKE